jgi:hypothetical protein
MAYHYEIEPERQLVIVHMGGAVTREEIAASRAAVAGDPLFKPGFSELVDLRDLTSSDALTIADLQQLASSAIDPVKRRAFVVHDPATYGLIRIYDGMRSLMPQHEQVRLFKNMTDAEAWLGLSPGK